MLVNPCTSIFSTSMGWKTCPRKGINMHTFHEVSMKSSSRVLNLCKMWCQNLAWFPFSLHFMDLTENLITLTCHGYQNWKVHSYTLKITYASLKVWGNNALTWLGCFDMLKISWIGFFWHQSDCKKFYFLVNTQKITHKRWGN